MSSRSLLFAATLAVFLAALFAILIFHLRKSRRKGQDDWESLLDRLLPVDRASVALIALDLLSEPRPETQVEAPVLLDPADIYGLIGGLRGLETLEANCNVLIDLACYAQRQFPEALVVAEQLRLNAREIQWNVGRLKAAAERGRLDSTFPDYAQRAVATYYGMTRRVLELYQATRLPGLQELQEAV